MENFAKVLIFLDDLRNHIGLPALDAIYAIYSKGEITI